MIVVAHAVHWFSQLLYVAPVAVVAVLLYGQSLRDKRRTTTDASPEEQA